ncbi:MAG: OmpH family outer membrane protein [Planctomycetota bacterium]|nr:OmpH family outer membrane protein [Planctomycetota bacterium]
MTQLRTIVNRPIALCLLLLAAAVVAPSYAVWSIGPSRPAIIASVDLEKVFNDIGLRAEAEIELDQLKQRFQEEADALRKEATRLEQDLDLLVRGTPQYQKAEKEYKQVALDFRALVEFNKAKLGARRAEARKDIFDQIVRAAGSFAGAHGIDYILADDSRVNLQEGSELQIVQQISLRRVVYADPAFDITDELIGWINQR